MPVNSVHDGGRISTSDGNDWEHAGVNTPKPDKHGVEKSAESNYEQPPEGELIDFKTLNWLYVKTF